MMDRPYVNTLSRRHQLVRLAWTTVWTIGASWLPRSLGCGWKRLLLRLFGARIHSTAVVYSSTKIYYPANLEMHAHSCLSSGVDCYNVDRVTIGEYATVSQNSTLCTASHDISDPAHRLTTAPIVIEREAWVAAEAFIGPGVKVGEKAVVGARGAVFKDVEPMTVIGGNPARFIKRREIKDA